MEQHLTRAVVTVVAAFSVVGAGRAPTQIPAAEPAPGPVRMEIELAKSEVVAGETPTFRLSLRNVGHENLLLNGGFMLGNGKQSWSSIQCVFRSTSGQEVPLALHWGVSSVGGRVYFLGLPLRPGDKHSIEVAPRDYYVQFGKPLSVGTYELQCSYHGAESQFRERTELPPCWEGQAVAQPVRFEVRPAKPEATANPISSLPRSELTSRTRRAPWRVAAARAARQTCELFDKSSSQASC